MCILPVGACHRPACGLQGHCSDAGISLVGAGMQAQSCTLRVLGAELLGQQWKESGG